MQYLPLPPFHTVNPPCRSVSLMAGNLHPDIVVVKGPIPLERIFDGGLFDRFQDSDLIVMLFVTPFTPIRLPTASLAASF